jgi:hypothetical protein
MRIRQVVCPLMSSFRRILFSLLMALAVVLGQQAVALHDLSHATGHKKESTTGSSTCDKCFACAELSSAVGSTIPPVTLPDSAPQAFDVATGAVVCTAPRLAFRSRAPPTLL